MSESAGRVCPSCGTENEADAVFCKRCASALGAEAGQATPPPAPSAWPSPESPGWASPGVPAPTAPAAEPPVALPAQPEGYQLTHRGQRYGAGYGPGFYGVWDLRIGGSPIAWFDRTPAGWESAWRRFQDLEGAGGIPSWRRAHAGWVLLHIVIAAAIWFAQLFVLGMVLAAVLGPDRAADIDSLATGEESALGAAALLTLVTSFVGWMLFVYLRSSAKVRGWTLAGVLGAGFAVLVAVALAVVPG